MLGFPGASDGKEFTCNSGDPDSIPESGRSPEEESGNSLQYSCLENTIDRGAWRATAHGVATVRHDLVTKPPQPEMGFPSGSDCKESAYKCRKPRFNPWVRKILWRREWQLTPVFLPGEFHGQEEPDELQSMGSQRIRHN